MNRFLIAILLCLFTLPTLAKNTILILGDSLSAGYGINPEKSWPALLQQRLKTEHTEFNVVNASISGDTTSNGLTRLPIALKQYQPVITVIELGANDGLRGLQLSTIKANLKNMIFLAKAANSKILLLGLRLPPNYGPVYTQAFQQLFIDVAKEENIPVIPLLLDKLDTHPNMLQADRLHPTQAAQTTLLDNVWPTLKTMLK